MDEFLDQKWLTPGTHMSQPYQSMMQTAKVD
jgi:hypothetical protein